MLKKGKIFLDIFNFAFPVYEKSENTIRIKPKYEDSGFLENLSHFGWKSKEDSSVYVVPVGFEFELDSWMMHYFGINTKRADLRKMK